MSEKNLGAAIDTVREKHPQNYNRFVRNGDDAIEVLEDGAQELEGYALATEIEQASEYECPEFTGIVNFLADVGILEPWGDTKSYRIDTEPIKEGEQLEEVELAWDYAEKTGEVKGYTKSRNGDFNPQDLERRDEHPESPLEPDHPHRETSS